MVSMVINYGKGGYKMGKLCPKLVVAPPPPPLPQDRVKLFAPHLLKGGNFLCPYFSMAIEVGAVQACQLLVTQER